MNHSRHFEKAKYNFFEEITEISDWLSVKAAECEWLTNWLSTFSRKIYMPMDCSSFNCFCRNGNVRWITFQFLRFYFLVTKSPICIKSDRKYRMGRNWRHSAAHISDLVSKISLKGGTSALFNVISDWETQRSKIFVTFYRESHQQLRKKEEEVTYCQVYVTQGKPTETFLIWIKG